MMGNLGLQIRTYLGRPVSDTEVQAFALEDERSSVDADEGDELLEDEEENDEDVVIEDPSVMIDAVSRLKTYFRNTACPEGVY